MLVAVVLAAVALLTVMALALTVLALIGRVRRLARTVSRLQDELRPQLAALAADTEVARTELERVGDRLDAQRSRR